MMTSFLLFAEIIRLWYALPLIVSVSLSYAATRHEDSHEILSHAARFAGWVIGFMVIVTSALQLMAWQQ